MKAAGKRQKGARVERELVEAHLAVGVPAKRVPLSGAQAGWKGDLLIADTFRGEAKARKGANGFKVIEQWLEGNDILFLKRDRKDPFVAMTFDSYLVLIKALLRETGQETSGSSSAMSSESEEEDGVVRKAKGQ